MLTLPPNITKKIYCVKKNTVCRCYGQDNIVLDNTNVANIKSRTPFIFEQEEKRILFTSNPQDNIPEDCPYAILVNRKPTETSFTAGVLKIIRWLKHPIINDALTPDEVALSWRGKFTYVEEDRDAGLNGLRQPQAGAIHAWLSSQHSRKDRATIVMPTGTGKTETMLGIMVAGQCKKLLVTVPSDALRDQISGKFITLGKLHEFGIVSNNCKDPYVAIIDNGIDDANDWEEILEHSNVVVTTMALLIKTTQEIRDLLHRSITHVFVDEAHHSEAPSWSDFLEGFDRTKITQFTATPFRNDGRKLKGTYVYSFSLKAAQQQGYYQRINFSPVYEIDKNNADQAIANRAIEILRRDRNELGKNHILMARCKDKNRAEQVFACYQNHEDLHPIVIHSTTTGKSRILACIIHRGFLVSDL